MSKNKLIIVDLNHFVGGTLPVSDRTFFQCINCWAILRSSDNDYCICGNVSVDVDAGRAGARDEHLLRVLQIVHVD
jgi:hypothetical protein